MHLFPFKLPIGIVAFERCGSQIENAFAIEVGDDRFEGSLLVCPHVLEGIFLVAVLQHGVQIVFQIVVVLQRVALASRFLFLKEEPVAFCCEPCLLPTVGFVL